MTCRQSGFSEYKGEMSLEEHLEELRERLFKSIGVLVIGMIVAYMFFEPIMKFIVSPAGKLYYMKPAEAFYISIKICAVSGGIIALPLIFYQFWSFLLPAFSLESRKLLAEMVLAGTGLFICGIVFAYYFVLPLGLKFFLGFASANINPIISMENYLDFFLTLILPFGFVFNLPLILVVMAKVGMVDSYSLAKYRKSVVLICFFVAAILTPPDVLSQILLAIPLMLLYEVSIWCIKYVVKH